MQWVEFTLVVSFIVLIAWHFWSDMGDWYDHQDHLAEVCIDDFELADSA